MMQDPTKTLDTILQAIDDVRRAAPVTAAGRTQMNDALGHLYLAEEAIRKSLAADAGKVETYAVTRADGKIVRVTVPA